MELPQLIELLKRNAEYAVTFDSEGNKEAAIYYYLETVAQINFAKNLNKDDAVDLSAFLSKAKEYSSRAETLKTFLNTQEENSKQSTSNSPTKNGATAGKTRKV